MLTYLQICSHRVLLKIQQTGRGLREWALLVKFLHISLRTHVQSPVLTYKDRYGGVHLEFLRSTGDAEREGLGLTVTAFWPVSLYATGEFKASKIFCPKKEWHL